jgi:prepilin-type N-terminal cleavage/methylation domain-containing protein
MSLSRSTKQVLGFTLIELLIVVAIIAILAAIAVPNFLEAQTRAKVARVQSDERNIANALECYMVDNKGYPLSDLGLGNLANTDYPPVAAPPPPAGNGHSGQVDHRPFWLNFLTTPTSYITALPTDTFSKSLPVDPTVTPPRYIKDRFKYYSGDTLGDGLTPTTGRTAHRTAWALVSVGPTQAMTLTTTPPTAYAPGDCTPKFVNFVRSGSQFSPANGQNNVGDQNFMFVNQQWMWSNGNQVVSVCLVYDPSNGTSSDGHIARTGGVQVDQFLNYPNPNHP